MKWLVTGCEGFIGSHLCKYLVQRHSVLGTYLDKPEDPGFDMFSMDILNKDNIYAAFKHFNPDCVVHLAGAKDVSWCENNAEEAYKLNSESVESVAEACQEFSCGLIFLSSDYVFDGKQGNYSLTSPCRPQTIYGKTKLKAEQILKGL